MSRSRISLRRAGALTTTLMLLAGLLPVPVAAAPTELFFSEYIEGSSNNKALEVYNGTAASVPLGTSGYNIQMFFNGNPSAGLTINLAGSVAAGDVYVLAHASANATILAQADQTNGAGWFNGDDAVVLRKGTTVIDVIGQIGFDPGTEWGTGLTSTADNTLRRMDAIESGDAVGNDAFDPSAEWNGFATDTFDGLGWHITVPPTGVGAADPSTVPYGSGASVLLTVDTTPGASPPSTGITVSADLAQIGGSSAQPFFDDGTNGDVTAADGTFSFLTSVDEDTPSGRYALPFTVADAEGRSSAGSIALTVVTFGLDIHDVQGASHTSPYVGAVVGELDGIVTATRTGGSGGFWMTDPAPDADDATSEGVFVFTAGTPSVAVGDLATVQGTVAEFRPGGTGGFENLTITELTSPTYSSTPSGASPPVTVVGDGGRIPPSEVIDNDTATADRTIDSAGAVTTFDPAEDGIDFWESLEGMYLQVNDALVVGPRNNFGEIAIVGDGGAHAGPFTARGGLLIEPGSFNPERILLDDVLNATPMVNVGDGFTTAVTGVLDYSFGNFKLLTTTALTGVDNGLQKEVTKAPDDDELAVATFNVENLTFGNPQAKYDALAATIVGNLQAPDLLAIEEIQDDNGLSGGAGNPDATAEQTWGRLIDSIVAAGGPTYEYRQIDPVANADGGAPGGNIRVGFLFRTDRGLEFVDRPGGNAVTSTEVVAADSSGSGRGRAHGAQLTLSPGRVLDGDLTDGDAFIDTRKSLAGEFLWRGETVFVIVNHFSSKGDDHPLFGRFQQPVRFTEFASGTPEDGWRHAQAQVINDFVDEILAIDRRANVIVLGDINDFHFSETVDVLTGVAIAGTGGPDADGSGPTIATGDPAVLTTLVDTIRPNERYSYVFEGNSQVLDQILVSGTLISRDPSYDVVHVNSEFALQVSDHEPAVMRVIIGGRGGR